MACMEYYKESHLIISYDRKLDAVIMDWQSFAGGEQYREGLEAGLELVRRRRAANWLVDLGEVGTDAGGEWSPEEWFQRALRTPLERMALVHAEHPVAGTGVESVQPVGDGDLTAGYFDDRREAKAWLAGQ